MEESPSSGPRSRSEADDGDENENNGSPSPLIVGEMNSSSVDNQQVTEAAHNDHPEHHVNGIGGDSAPPPPPVLLPTMDLQRARNYVSKVKSVLGPTSLKFREFLDILSLYSRRELGPEEVIARINQLFRQQPQQQQRQPKHTKKQQQIQQNVKQLGGDEQEKSIDQDEHAPVVDNLKELILGFNEFLPPGYRISNTTHPTPTKIPSSQARKKRRLNHHGKKIPNAATSNSVAPMTSATNAIIIGTTTQIVLSPPKIDPSRDLLYDYNPINQIILGRCSNDDVGGSNIEVDDDNNNDDDDDGINSNNIDALHTIDDYKDGNRKQPQPLLAHLPVNCELCRGKRNAIAETNQEPILLCEQKGCNAEYHLGCLYDYRPSLFSKVDRDKKEKEGDDNVMDVAAVNTTSPLSTPTATSTAAGGGSNTMADDDGSDSENGFANNTDSSTKMIIPPGEIYCAQCHSDGSTAVLEKYFDKVDYERSHFTCSRAYVVALLENHMKQNPEGNVIIVDENSDDGGGGDKTVVANNDNDGEIPSNKNGDDNKAKTRDDTTTLPRRRSRRLRRQLKNTPRSELWYPHELQAQILLPTDDRGVEINEENRKCNNVSLKTGDGDFSEVTTSAEFLVGKPVRLYNNLDNEYHHGRIVDWRKCTVYPRLTPLPYEYTDDQNFNDDGMDLPSVNNTFATVKSISIDHLDYYGAGPLSSCEFLVRFPSGLQGRRKELLQWVLLEEHSLAVGVSLILGKKSKLSRSVDWKPAMILARSALELVPVRSFLHEDEHGALFATMATERENTHADDRWSLASFFGEEQHDLLRLRDESCGLLCYPNLVRDASIGNGTVKNQTTGCDSVPVDDAINGVQLFHQRNPLASLDVPLALALAEHDEQIRCKVWNKLLLRQRGHRLALVLSDEYATQLNLENTDVSKASSNSKSDVEKLKVTSNTSIRPLVERGLDRMWLAQLLDKTPSPPSANSPLMKWSKDDLIKFKCERLLSVSKAMASLQSQ